MENATVTRTRRSLASLIADALTAAGKPVEVTHSNGINAYVLDGETLTPGEIASRLGVTTTAGT